MMHTGQRRGAWYAAGAVGLLLLMLLASPRRIVPLASAQVTQDYYTELYRPQFHFSPEANWMNDPNGLVYYQGEYHLFYQYYPHGMVWGPMHWGHAVSTDLVRWTHLPVALFPDSLGYIYSGSAVVDWNNTSGFFTNSGGNGLVAIFTHDNNGVEQQSIAYSTDRGRTWTKYAGNPVIPNSVNMAFRDPKVFWYAPTSRWVMIVAGGTVRFYSSANLKNWTLESTLSGVDTECPDLFELPVDGNAANKKWVLSKGGREYLIGRFDGHVFTTESGPFPADSGPDFYAAQSWSDIPAADGRRIWIGWMANPADAQVMPTSPWRSEMSLPRRVELKTFPDGIRMVQTPVTELQSLRGARTTLPSQTLSPGSNPLASVRGATFDLTAEFQLGTATEFGLRVRTGGTQQTTISYTPSSSRVTVDRRTSGNNFGSCCFPAAFQATLAPVSGRVKLRLLVDNDSVEVFGNDGRLAMSVRIFPDAGSTALALYSVGGNVTLTSFDLYQLGRSWPNVAQEASGIANADFETGNLSGWTVASGVAFSAADVTNLTTASGGNGQAFKQHGSYHLWSFKDGADAQVGELRSQTVTLGGSGQVSLLVSGGFEQSLLTAALVRASDGATLFSATGHDSETYRRVIWDAAAYRGQSVYLRVRDSATGGWGHLNLDDVHIPAGTAPTPTPTATPTSGTISPTTWYSIQNVNSAKCVDANNAGTANGTIVLQWDCIAANFNQQWLIVPTDGGYYRLMARHAQTQAIDVEGGTSATGNGARTILWQYSGGTNQQWKPESTGAGIWRFRARHSNRCLDVPGGAATNGLQLQQWDCNGGNNQNFRLIAR
jgi:sucrose-6-phosphate hydrolase SacC (GH32 family)